jgi:hypothetical protein
MFLQLALSVAVYIASDMASAPATDIDCGAVVCVYGSDPTGQDSWKPDARLSRKQRAKDAKANRKRADVTLDVDVVGGRGSVFIDGRYLAASGPHDRRVVKPGKHEIEIRDGERIIAVGVLTIARKNVEAVTLVVHADR